MLLRLQKIEWQSSSGEGKDQTSETEEQREARLQRMRARLVAETEEQRESRL